MTRVSTFVAAVTVMPALLSAQAPPPPRPPQPAPPAPVVVAPMPVMPIEPMIAPLPPLPMVEMPLEPLLAPMAPLPIIELPDLPMVAPLPLAAGVEQWRVDELRRRAQEAVAAIDVDQIRRAAEEGRAAVWAIDQERLSEQVRETAREAARIAEANARVAREFDMAHWAPLARFSEHSFAFEQSSDAGAYNSAMSALNSRQYERALTYFDRVIVQKGAHADAALYWKAFAQFRLGRSAEALESIGQLRRDHAQSAYAREARVLEADVKRSSGQPVNPAAIDDDEIKLLAISGIQKSDPERAIPLLEGVLNATNSLSVKRRALYVLALSDHPRAHEILMSYAKGGGTPDLQRVAIEYIASRRDRQTTSADLREIYNSTNDTAVKMAIISAYREAGDKDALVAIVTNAGAPVELRTSAVSGLSRLASPQDVWALYQKEQNPELRTRMLGVLSSMQASDLLIQAAKSERDAEVRVRAVRYLGSQKPEVTGQALVDLYASDTDVNVRKSIISALSQQTNAEGLVAIARRENSLELTREIVSRLSNMAAKSKVAADYLMEIIKR
jgi:hypothetical protein